MPIILVEIISALASGGSLVPHAAGGLIVSGSSGYVASTYLSTAAVSSLITTASGTLGMGALYFSGITAGVSSAAAGIVGSSGVFGTTIGATGIKGALMSVGLIASTPVWIPIATGGAALGCGYGGYLFFKLKRKVNKTPEGKEARFTDAEAKIIEKIITLLGKKKLQ
jgi:hypothetical protein